MNHSEFAESCVLAIKGRIDHHKRECEGLESIGEKEIANLCRFVIAGLHEALHIIEFRLMIQKMENQQ